ncbi:MAG: oxidoreductase [Acetobacteraceae bacterium]|jgi:NAD(P)H-quinone oxidoreductase subunit 5|nr:oxidoreductase [Acetobacteraceae bacterium]
MTAALAWLALAGPLALTAAALASPPPDARRLADRCFVAGLAALGLALALGFAVAASGRLVTPTLGLAGLGLGVHLDALSAVLFILVAFIGAVVLRYSRNYLAGDPGHAAFLRGLSLTLAAVLTLIVAGNLLLLAAAWVATSLGLNRLLLFYGERQAARFAAAKEFAVSRLGDAALITAFVLIVAVVGRGDIASVRAAAEAMAASGEAPGALGLAAVLIVLAALLKSAQFPTHGWLLEVMETPTPVSALLHAGIINAGGFLVLRFADVMILPGPALEVLALVGGLTAIFGSVVMLTQTSVKVSLAWSTVAQMGFMMLQCGLGAFSAALLHIVAHSLYKAHAFLASGSVIDLARASWTAGPSGQPHPARLVLALALVLAVTAGIAAVFGITPAEKPGVLVLAAILVMGLVHLMASAIDTRPNAYVLGRTAAVAGAVAALYFALQAGAEVLVASSLPPMQPLRGPLDLVIAVLMVTAFAAITVLQSEMSRHTRSPFWQAVYVHLSHGLYVNTLANRWAARFRPAPRRLS